MTRECAVVLCSVVVATSLSGCLAISTKQRIETDEKSRVSVKFESAEAAAIFHAKLDTSKIDRNAPFFGKTTFGIPFIVLIDHRILYETTYYNAQVRKADINADGNITLEEANNLK